MEKAVTVNSIDSINSETSESQCKKVDKIDPAALQRRIDELREKRNARQAARLELLKNIHLKKVPKESPFLMNKNEINSKKETVKTVQTNQANTTIANSHFESILTKSRKIQAADRQMRKSLFPHGTNVKPETEIKRQTLNPSHPLLKKPDPPKTSSQVKSGSLKAQNGPISSARTKSSLPNNQKEPDSSVQTKGSLLKPQNVPDSSARVKSGSMNIQKKPESSIKTKINLSNLQKKRDSCIVKNFSSSTVQKKTNGSIEVKMNSSVAQNKSAPLLAANKTTNPTMAVPPTKNLKPANATKRFTLHGYAPKQNKSVPIPAKRRTLHNTQKVQESKQEDNSKPENLRRSLSTLHFKRLGNRATASSIRRSFSSGNIKYKEIEEELPSDYLPQNYVMPIESEKKKSVTFFTPLRKYSTISNTPKPSELRKRLNDWLQKRGKSLSTYHHLKCFGLHAPHNATAAVEPNLEDDDNKENIDVLDDHDSFSEIMTGKVVDNAKNGNSPPIDSASCIKSPDNLVSDALYDLHQLILENYSWLQCAEWLRTIVRECGDKVKNIPAYWECRAALEENRGDFVRTLDCFQNALKQGAHPTNIEESLDNLLQKFMKLNLDPSTQNNQQEASNQRLVDVRNVFKSSLIRFAIKEQHTDEEKPSKQYVATPVRRSSRLTGTLEKFNNTKFTPKLNDRPIKNISNDTQVQSTKAYQPKERKHLVQLCDSLRNVDEDIKQTLVFVPNKALNFNDRM